MSEIDEREASEIMEAERDAIRKTIGSKSLLTFIETEQLRKDVSFSEHNIDDAMSEQASLYSYYATQSTKAQLQSDRAKHQMEIVEAKVYKSIRDENAGKKITEAMISKEVMLDKRYIAAVKRYNEAKMIAALTKEATEALKQRRDMLIQTSKHHLEGQKGELFLKAKNQSIEDKKHAALGRIRDKN